MFFKHIYDETLAQGSYMIGCQVTGETIVIDAQRDVDVYLKIAEEKNLKITHITETHIHADYLSGSRELAAITGAELLLSEEGGTNWQYEFPHRGLKDGDAIKVGNLSLEVVHTPGHTPESISFLLTDHPASDQPVMVFTGDFVFVGDVGRPDLLEEAAGIKGTKREGAQQMFQSLKKFQDIPDYVQVWPAHGAGSACGKALGAVASSTVGYEKIRNWAFQYKDEEEFIDLLISDQPEPPKYFKMMKHLNKVPRRLLVEVPKHSMLTDEEFLSAYRKGITVVDARNRTEFALSHILDSINIEGGKSFSTWAGWVLNYEEQFIIIADENQMEDLTRKLMRIGLDNIYGFYNGVYVNGVATDRFEVIDYNRVKELMNKEEVQIVDVRGNSEYKTYHIPGAINAFVGTIQDHLDKIDPDKKLIVHCKSGTRAAVANSILRKNGFKNTLLYAGGMDDWEAHELQTSEINA